MFLVLIAVTCRTWPRNLGFSGFWPRKTWNAGLFFSVAGKATLLWPGLPLLKTLALTGLTRLFQATLSWQARPRPWQAWPGQAFDRACHAFDRAPDTRAVRQQWIICCLILAHGNYNFFAEGAFYFSKEPGKNIYFLKGGNATFEWNYVVDDRAAEFWYLKFERFNATAGSYSILIWEEKDFSIKMNPFMPPTYVGRVYKINQATFVVESLQFMDSATYQCHYISHFGPTIHSQTYLVVTGMR